MSARTEFVSTDERIEATRQFHALQAAVAELQGEFKCLSGVVETLIARSLTASQNDADLLCTDVRLENELQDVRNRLAALEKGQSPYNRFVEPAPLWGDSTDPGSTIRKRRQKP